ncbi:MAG: hypothetical protein H8E15_09585 [Planctomycetes bacterium]|nr:hypothetical protein [Planctomycetota bacterium]
MNSTVQGTQSVTRRRKGPWSHAELDKLKRKYGKVSDKALGRDLNRSVESVRRIAKKVFKGDLRTGPWAPKEVYLLKEYWGVAEILVMELVLRRTQGDILRKVKELRGEVRSRPWLAEDLQLLKRHYGTRSSVDLVVILGRPEADIEEKASEFRLAKDKGFQRRRGTGKRVRMPRWTKDDVEKLAQLYPDTPNLDIAHALNRTLKSAVSKAHDLGLKKSSSRLRDMGRENVRLRYQKQSPSYSTDRAPLP